MKFKSKEELIKEFYDDMGCYIPDDNDYRNGIIDAFQSFAERIEFYKKYHGKPEMFRIDYPTEHANFIVWKEKGFGPDNYLGDDFAPWVKDIRFDNWLFDHCFGDEE